MIIAFPQRLLSHFHWVVTLSDLGFRPWTYQPAWHSRPACAPPPKEWATWLIRANAKQQQQQHHCMLSGRMWPWAVSTYGLGDKGVFTHSLSGTWFVMMKTISGYSYSWHLQMTYCRALKNWYTQGKPLLNSFWPAKFGENLSVTLNRKLIRISILPFNSPTTAWPVV